MNQEPLIVIGMHRSGTALVSRILSRLGVFMGWRKEENVEAVFFLRCNNLLLAAAGGRWDNPGPAAWLLDDERERAAAVKLLRRRLDGAWTWEYLGPWRFLSEQSLFRLKGAWGWKDPRTTITLPLWRELFPAARVIHVVRHGVDVAASLARREERLLDAAWKGYGTVCRCHFGREGRDVFPGSPRALSLAGGFSLWEEYLELARRHTAGLGDRLLEFRYEDLVAKPEEVAAGMAAFAGISAGAGQLRDAVPHVRVERSLAWRHDDRLTEFRSRVAASPWLAAYGYVESP